MSLVEIIFGDLNKKEIKKIEKIVDKIEAYDESMQNMSDEELRAKTLEFKERLSNGETLDDILPEAFAVCREAAWRSLGMKPFRVQLIGGVALHQGRISEMKTGEGKTLVATLPAYLNALEGKGVHVVTVNDYLAKRDAEQMGKLYGFLGLTTGCVIHDVEGDERRNQYLADITYATNNELGFDYLRDNMMTYKEDLLQRELNFAIVDEVDSILIDEARTPLIISGPGVDSSDMYRQANSFVKFLNADDYKLDEKDKQISLTEVGIEKCENHFDIENFSDPDNMELNHYVMQALRANYIMKKDIDYIVSDEGEVLIVDEFTGRIMYGRRFSNGLHQAIEAKEGVQVQAESKTYATITLQNYFRMYNKLSGMTGTAKTEEDEFRDIYNMDVVVVPTNKPIIRNDKDDIVYTTLNGKFNAIVNAIAEAHETGQPVLVGTISIETSEHLSSLLKKRGIKHKVLNAKYHEREAEIIADAGRFGAVTIATNMAGRGTDIILGGNPEFEAKRQMKLKKFTPEQIHFAMSLEKSNDPDLNGARRFYRNTYEKLKSEREEEQKRVIEAGGLKIIGTERHESRRIDNQLRGRSGRQGDPGDTCFYLSLEDDLMRLFGGEKMQKMIDKMGFSGDKPITAGLLSKSIENAQKKVEGRNFSARKYVLQYDDIMNRQRTIIYDQRKMVLDGEDLKNYIENMTDDLICTIINSVTVESKYAEEWNLEKAWEELEQIDPDFRGKISYTDEEKAKLTEDSLIEDVKQVFRELYKKKESEIGADQMREVERMIMLRVVDNRWMEHIDAMDQLKEGIGLRGIGQQDPAQAYAKEGFDMFDEMVADIREEIVKFCYNATVTTNTERKKSVQGVAYKQDYEESLEEEVSEKKPQPIHRADPKIGRNDPCPCGSGKKYKNCCGAK